jgi:hypothetical protein
MGGDSDQNESQAKMRGYSSGYRRYGEFAERNGQLCGAMREQESRRCCHWQ